MNQQTTSRLPFEAAPPGRQRRRRLWRIAPILASQSPPSAGSTAPISPWSASAFSVLSGMVFTVFGAASALMYSTSEALGSLVPGARPQQALRIVTGFDDGLPARRSQQIAIGLVGAFGDRDAELVAQCVGHFARNRNVPAADEYRGYRANLGVQVRRRCDARCLSGRPRRQPGIVRARTAASR